MLVWIRIVPVRLDSLPWASNTSSLDDMSSMNGNEPDIPSSYEWVHRTVVNTTAANMRNLFMIVILPGLGYLNTDFLLV